MNNGTQHELVTESHPCLICGTAIEARTAKYCGDLCRQEGRIRIIEQKRDTQQKELEKLSRLQPVVEDIERFYADVYRAFAHADAIATHEYFATLTSKGINRQEATTLTQAWVAQRLSRLDVKLNEVEP